ncbi:hypothetical protein B566_EDAN002888 [Ephemera danica]|nr:hypothetical protein B566_EDAN002888 [Ephemera danica]
MLGLLALCCLLVIEAARGGVPTFGGGGGTVQELTKCPWACSCLGLAVDCSNRGLTQVPRNLPTAAERV